MKRINIISNFEIVLVLALIIFSYYKSINGMFSGLALMLLVIAVTTYYFPIYSLVKYNKNAISTKELILSLISYLALGINIAIIYFLLQGWFAEASSGVFYFFLSFLFLMILVNLKRKISKDIKFLVIGIIILILNIYLIG